MGKRGLYLLLKTGSSLRSDYVSQYSVQSSLENLGRWRMQNLSMQPVPVSDLFKSEDVKLQL